MNPSLSVSYFSKVLSSSSWNFLGLCKIANNSNNMQDPNNQNNKRNPNKQKGRTRFINKNQYTYTPYNFQDPNKQRGRTRFINKN